MPRGARELLHLFARAYSPQGNAMIIAAAFIAGIIVGWLLFIPSMYALTAAWDALPPWR